MKKQLRRGNDPDPGVPAYIINERDWNYFEGFAMHGGWREALRRTGAAWRDNGPRLLLVNLLWGCLFFSVAGVPPATAMLFLAARRALNREALSYDMTVYSLKRYARQSWLWSLTFLLTGVLMYGIFSLVRSQIVPSLFGWVGQALFVVWSGLNLFYWPLWWHTIPEQRDVTGTWRRMFAYWRNYPLPCTAAVLVSALLITLTVLSGWFFIFLLLLLTPITVALVGTAVVGAYPPRE